MHCVALAPIGIQVTELSIGDLDADAVSELKRLLGNHGVVVMPGQVADDTAFVGFLKQFGALVFTKGELPVSGSPDLNVVSNVGRSTASRSVFHVDTSYVRRPPAYTALRAVQIPTRGGETLFSDQFRAFDTLCPQIRAALQGRSIKHVVTGLDLGENDETAAEHPVLRQHPISGRTALYLSTPERCVGITGMGQAEASEMIEFLYAHSTSEDNIFRHVWESGDIVMWDNACVMHRGDHAKVVGNRVLHRGMVAGAADKETGVSGAS